MTVGDGQLRIGTAERESASRALNTHLEEGRLGVEEYADRSAKAAVATTAAELTELFTDLPAPHPSLPGSRNTATLATAANTQPSVTETAAPARFSGWGTRIAASSPILALVLFVALNSVHFPYAWLAFLLIPLVGAMGFSRERQEAREREREQRRILRDRDRRER
ncbi:hypothetical protein GCM10009836_66520 [Pseudonocardia ailaonensis]|uniref:DUF1707 domain-containing protein n=1 Tax=Pseudonocardia ailaonensis TaxID=367279 RepID=A0ABN2NMI3_9PSEU